MVLFPTSLRKWKHQKRTSPNSYHLRYPNGIISHMLGFPAYYHRWTTWTLLQSQFLFPLHVDSYPFHLIKDGLAILLCLSHTSIFFYWIILISLPLKNDNHNNTSLNPILASAPFLFLSICSRIPRKNCIYLFVSTYFPFIPFEPPPIRFYPHSSVEIAFSSVINDLHVVNYNGQSSDLDLLAACDALPLR